MNKNLYEQIYNQFRAALWIREYSKNSDLSSLDVEAVNTETQKIMDRYVEAMEKGVDVKRLKVVKIHEDIETKD